MSNTSPFIGLLGFYLIYMVLYFQMFLNSLEYYFAKSKPSEQKLGVFLDTLDPRFKILLDKRNPLLRGKLNSKNPHKTLFEYLQDISFSEVMFRRVVYISVCLIPSLVIFLTLFQSESNLEFLNGLFWFILNLATWLICLRFGKQLIR